MSVTINPAVTTNAAGTFGVATGGYIAGTANPDPASRYKLRQVLIAAGVTAEVYGGVGLAINTGPSGAASGAVNAASPVATVATAVGNLAGFAVFDQSPSGIQTTQSTVPLFTPGETIGVYEFGSGACIALPISAANAANLLSVSENTQLSWDYTNQVVIPYTNSGANAGAIYGPGPSGTAVIVDVQIGNSWIVVPNNPAAGQATWNEAGAVVVLRI